VRRHSAHFTSSAESKSSPEKAPFLTKILIPFGAVLVAGLGLLIQNVPWWVTAFIVTYITAVILALAIPAAMQFIRVIKKGFVRRAVARRYIPQMRRFLTVFLPHLEDSRTETVLYVWRNASSLDEGRRIVQLDYGHIRTLQDWFSSLDDRLSSASSFDFEQICEELARAVFHYNVLCERVHREIEALSNASASVANQAQLRYVKQEWNNARDKHNQTIKAWEDVTKSINHDAGRNLCMDHYSLLKTIS